MYKNNVSKEKSFVFFKRIIIPKIVVEKWWTHLVPLFYEDTNMIFLFEAINVKIISVVHLMLYTFVTTIIYTSLEILFLFFNFKHLRTKIKPKPKMKKTKTISSQLDATERYRQVLRSQTVNKNKKRYGCKFLSYNF